MHMAMFNAYVRLFVWFSWRNLRRHATRTLAVLLGIAIGAAVFTSVRIAINATLESFSRSMDLISGTSDVTLIQPGGRLPDSLVAPLLNHPDVKAVSPMLSAYVRPANKEIPFLLIGFDPILDRQFRSWRTRGPETNDAPHWVNLMNTPYSLLIGTKLSKQLNWHLDHQITLTHMHRSAVFNVLGVLDTTELALVEGGRVAFCDIATYQEFTGLFGLVDRIDIMLRAGVNEEVVASLKKLLPSGVAIQKPTELKEAGEGMILAYKFSLTFLSFISLFVGMFLVYSLVAVNVAARRREIAVLQSVGASGRLLWFTFMAEGAFIGIFGWLLALPISTVMVKYFLSGVSRTVSMLFVRVHVDQITLSPWEILLSFCVTVAVSVVAALQPAFEANSIPPREALNLRPTTTIQKKTSHKMLLIGIGLLLLVLPVSRLPSPPAISLPGYAAALLLFVGFALVAPWGVQRMGSFLEPHLSRIGGQPAYMAAGYLKQSSVQTAISVGALITAVALFTSLVIMIHSFRNTVTLWVTQSIAGDLYIRPKMAELNRFRDPLPSPVVAVIKTLKEPVTLVPMRRLALQINGHPHMFEAMNYADYARRSHFIWMTGTPKRVESDLIAGKGVVVSEVFSRGTGLGIGDHYQVNIGGATFRAPILGMFRDYRTRGGVVYYSLSHYQQQFADFSWSGVQINSIDDNTDPSEMVAKIRSTLQTCCHGMVEIVDGADLRRAVLKIFDETFAITTVLLLISLLVAGLGIATTLAVMVLQRHHQINTIRAVGGSVGQIRNMIFWEAGLLVMAGQVAGLVCGFALSYLLIFVINPQSFGWTFLYRVDGFKILSALPLIFAAALLAALPAVRLALNSSPALLLRGESF